MKKRNKILIGVLTGLVVILLGAWFYLRAQVYSPSQPAQQAAESARVTNQWLYFKAEKTDTPAVVFYPGAFVSPLSYSIWAKKVAAAGYPVYVLQMPLALAVLKPNAADGVAKQTKRSLVVGGHSLGGVMASRYAHAHNDIQGVFFLASYPDQKGSLRGFQKPVLSITASRDGVLNWSTYRQAKQYLPTQTIYIQIKGGNHAGFGSYGHQKGDRTATISNAQQQEQIAQTMIKWLQQAQ